VNYGMSAMAGVSLCVSCIAMAGGHLLYERIGAQDGIATVVDGFLGKVGADDRVNGRFADTDMPKLRGLLIEQVCEATGGPCKYSGMNMLDAHKGMNITEAEFGIIAAHFAAAMSDAGVSVEDNGTIMGVLAGMHDDIVGQ
jgi:hemoglobin